MNDLQRATEQLRLANDKLEAARISIDESTERLRIFNVESRAWLDAYNKQLDALEQAIAGRTAK